VADHDEPGLVFEHRAQALVLTASPDPAHHARARRSGAAAVLSKLTDVDRVVDTARRL
jgi:DNA-binding NarL/FixJ family response regulator